MGKAVLQSGGTPDSQGLNASGLDYFVLDVFTSQRWHGNPLAVVMNTVSLSTSTMQAIAREMNLSETTFVERRDLAIEQREGVLVRIFTTGEELPFAGHPTLGTASLLRAIAPEVMTGNAVTLALKAGLVQVRFEAAQTESAQWPMRGEMTQHDPEFGEELDPAIVASLTGLTVEDFDPSMPIQIVSTGTAFAIVPLRSAESLERLHVRQDEASALLRARGARWFYVLGPLTRVPLAGDDSQSEAQALPHTTWQARMQFNGGEDPATGSAAGCAISHLVNRGAVASGQMVRLLQGIEINRPSEIQASATRIAQSSANPTGVTDVRVGGSTILVASGRLFLP